MKLLTENTLPPIIVTLAFSLCLWVISSDARAVEDNAIIGLYVTHTSSDTDFAAGAQVRKEAIAPHLETIARKGALETLQEKQPPRKRPLRSQLLRNKTAKRPTLKKRPKPEPLPSSRGFFFSEQEPSTQSTLTGAWALGPRLLLG